MSSEKNLPKSHIINLLLTKLVQWMFLFVCLWIKTESRSINSQKKDEVIYLAILTEQAWSITHIYHFMYFVLSFHWLRVYHIICKLLLTK